LEIFIATARSLGEQDIIGVFPTEADAKDAIKTWNPDQIHLAKIYVSPTLLQKVGAMLVAGEE
jgi:hypothetical protein